MSLISNNQKNLIFGNAVARKCKLPNIFIDNQLFANITTNNEASLLLFSNFGFQKIGIKKDWTKINGTFVDEVLFQFINEK